MSDIKFSQLPNLATPDAATIIPVVASGVNYTVTGANLQTFVNTAAGNITAGNITVTGNVQGAYILGNGSQLTGLPATYGNANVAVFLPTYSGNLNSVTAVPGAAVTGTVANAAYATSAGSAVSAVTATTAGTVTTAAQANITSVGTLTSLTATGNISANYFVGNGSLLTGISASSYGNADVTAFLPTYSGNLNSVTAVPGAAITGNVANATYAVSAGAATTATSATSATSALTAVTAGTVTTSAQANITSVGTLTSLAVTGNISGGNITTPGNVTASFYTGNGSLLSGVVSTTSNVLLSGGNFANTAVGNGKMWINGGNTSGAVGALLPSSVDNQFIISNGAGNNYLVLAPNGQFTFGRTGANSNVQINVGFNTITNTGMLTGAINASGKVSAVQTPSGAPFNGFPFQPASSTAVGVVGDICWTASYIYVCTATNTWKRVALSTF